MSAEIILAALPASWGVRRKNYKPTKKDKILSSIVILGALLVILITIYSLLSVLK